MDQKAAQQSETSTVEGADVPSPEGAAVPPEVRRDFALFDSVHPYVPTFISDVASHFSVQEQMTVFRRVCKLFARATPPFLPLYIELKHPAIDLMLHAQTYDTLPWQCKAGDELLLPHENLPMYGENRRDFWSMRLTCVETTEADCIFHVEARIRPDHPTLVDSFDLQSGAMTFHLPFPSTDDDSEESEIRKDFEGSIVGWAQELHEAHSSKEAPLATSLPEDAVQEGRWSAFAVVDLGKYSIFDFLGITPPEGWRSTLNSGYFDLPIEVEEWIYGILNVGNDKYYRQMRQFEEQTPQEGVCFLDNFLTENQRGSLARAIERLRASQAEPDYHPMSDNKVRDLVHPALFSYVKGESPFFGSLDLASPDDSPKWLKERPGEHAQSPAEDMWGRPYEDSKYQWLPTYFSVSLVGKVAIEGAINGIDRNAHPELYGELASLFQRALPLLEHAWTYGKHVKFFTEPDVPLDDLEMPLVEPLRGLRLQVITKIVDYELQLGQEYEGVWHVEGMSHENIVATAVYVAERDECIQGGALRFKRAFTQYEGNHFFYEVPQERSHFVEEFAEVGTLPIGTLETLDNRLLVFPNSHVHKIGKMVNNGSGFGRRRIVVFFLVNPHVRIVSTQEVPDQRNSMSLEQAKEHRLELMKERRLHKQDWNVRDLNLCEH